MIEGRKILKRIDKGEHIRGMEAIMAFGVVSLQEEYGNAPFDILPVHAVCIGDLAIVTQPCEPYCRLTWILNVVVLSQIPLLWDLLTDVPVIVL